MTYRPWKVFTIAFVAGIFGRVIGPPLGDYLAGLSDSRVWQVLPWLLIAVIWALLFRSIRRAQTKR